jgi:integrase/recombinase XerD
MGAFRRLLGEEPATVGRADVRRALLELMESRSRRTASNYGQAWRKLFRWLVAEGMIGVDPMEGVKLPQPELPDVAVIPDEAIEAMLRTTHGGKGTFEDVRDFAIMRVLLSGGPRAAEVRGMRPGDVNLDAGEIAVVGKGRKRRAVPLSDKACVALARYLRVRGRSPYAASSDALWLTRWGALTKQGLEKMLQRRARQAGLDESLTTPHKWRHTVASAWLEAGGREGDLMRVMGWSERKMLDRYGRFTAGRRAMLAHRALKHDKW